MLKNFITMKLVESNVVFVFFSFVSPYSTHIQMFENVNDYLHTFVCACCKGKQKKKKQKQYYFQQASL